MSIHFIDNLQILMKRGEENSFVTRFYVHDG